VLVDPTNATNTETTVGGVEAAARAKGLQIQVLNATNRREVDAAFATLANERADALLVGSTAFLADRRVQLAQLAARHAVAAIYVDRQFAEVGGRLPTPTVRAKAVVSRSAQARTQVRFEKTTAQTTTPPLPWEEWEQHRRNVIALFDSAGLRASFRLRTPPCDVARACGHYAGHIHRATDCQSTEESEQTEQGQRPKRDRKQQQVEHANGVLPMPQSHPTPFNEHLSLHAYPRIARLARDRGLLRLPHLLIRRLPEAVAS
jgi:hypothetical protein